MSNIKGKKIRNLAVAGLIVVLIGLMFIPAVGALAESALSVFRVNETKTIMITVADLQGMADYAKQNGLIPQSKTSGSMASNDSQAAKIESAFSQADQLSSFLKPIDNVRQFKAFGFSLPKSLKSETPKLYMADSQTKTFTVNTAEVNQTITKAKGNSIDSKYNGAQITVTTPPVIIAQYSAVTLLATTSVNIGGKSDVINGLWQEIVSQPMISNNLSSQLSAIDPTSHDVYLPVIQGLGREASLGGTTGYIYSIQDLKSVMSTLPGLPDLSNVTDKLGGGNASALIWTKNGVLYVLAGNKPDSELAAIARGVHSL